MITAGHANGFLRALFVSLSLVGCEIPLEVQRLNVDAGARNDLGGGMQDAAAERASDAGSGAPERSADGPADASNREPGGADADGNDADGSDSSHDAASEALSGEGRPWAGVGTDPDLKVAFIGDTTDDSPGFKGVLDLIKNEGAAAVVVGGDMSYSADPTAWWATVEGTLGPTFPVFMAEGNHDASSWGGYQPKAEAHVKASGAMVDQTKLGNRAYKYTWKGLSMVFLGEDGDSKYPRFVEERFAGDRQTWKVCTWHKNQKAMQIGGKGDEMGWAVYEACLKAGAIIMTAHEHSYERTKTLTSAANQTVDPACGDPKALCLAPGRVPVFVSGLGGNSIRDQERCLPSTYPYGCKNEWAFIYASNQGAKHGALFIDFTVNGDPKKAHGYFKTISGEVVDEFDITSP